MELCEQLIFGHFMSISLSCNWGIRVGILIEDIRIRSYACIQCQASPLVFLINHQLFLLHLKKHNFGVKLQWLDLSNPMVLSKISVSRGETYPLLLSFLSTFLFFSSLPLQFFQKLGKYFFVQILFKVNFFQWIIVVTPWLVFGLFLVAILKLIKSLVFEVNIHFRGNDACDNG